MNSPSKDSNEWKNPTKARKRLSKVPMVKRLKLTLKVKMRRKKKRKKRN